MVNLVHFPLGLVSIHPAFCSSLLITFDKKKIYKIELLFRSVIFILPVKTDIKAVFDSPIGSSGWKATSLTEPAWPGSLYRILRDVVSQIYTNL